MNEYVSESADASKRKSGSEDGNYGRASSRSSLLLSVCFCCTVKIPANSMHGMQQRSTPASKDTARPRCQHNMQYSGQNVMMNVRQIVRRSKRLSFFTTWDEARKSLLFSTRPTTSTHSISNIAFGQKYPSPLQTSVMYKP
ncbi:uncharacterized protein MYCFIDRAFT_170555 [Pseudocercospora fijiensis CIRAD86]|uniref:Uncharacterized protein n=1 Tax=Pseudocercospora fijiensis (strain CIRAD86) TaxID=383855 RepID=N1Q863_PSEFD|nr:uncharacterized protein MYCFIDRAFT_170555 [Pseudocercospora fijiensis CIRAD86]EME89019.1 hypothetical protein MYCFIDRAFT_170555 [Pseudocercospora fijiensis CIRAD86]